MLSTILNRSEVGLAQVICEAVIIILIAFEPVKNSYLKVFVKRLIAAFIVEECVLIAETYLVYMNILDDWKTIAWHTYEIIRVYISLSLCYPISLFIGENTQKLQRMLFIVCGLVGSGAVLDRLHFNNGHSGLNYIAFLFIFIFTLFQYQQLRQQTQNVIPRLQSLMILEGVLIILSGLLVFLFFFCQFNSQELAAIKNIIGFLQYHKIYLMISVLTYFE